MKNRHRRVSTDQGCVDDKKANVRAPPLASDETSSAIANLSGRIRSASSISVEGPSAVNTYRFVIHPEPRRGNVEGVLTRQGVGLLDVRMVSQLPISVEVAEVQNPANL